MATRLSLFLYKRQLLPFCVKPVIPSSIPSKQQRKIFMTLPTDTCLKRSERAGLTLMFLFREFSLSLLKRRGKVYLLSSTMSNRPILRVSVSRLRTSKNKIPGKLCISLQIQYKVLLCSVRKRMKTNGQYNLFLYDQQQRELQAKNKSHWQGVFYCRFNAR